jgi:hypothetical protein
MNCRTNVGSRDGVQPAPVISCLKALEAVARCVWHCFVDDVIAAERFTPSFVSLFKILTCRRGPWPDHCHSSLLKSVTIRALHNSTIFPFPPSSARFDSHLEQRGVVFRKTRPDASFETQALTCLSLGKLIEIPAVEKINGEEREGKGME